MKRLFTLSLAFTLAVSTCFAYSVPVSSRADATTAVPPGTVATLSGAPATVAAVTPGTQAMAPAPLKASEIRIPVGTTGKMVSLEQLSTMKVADYEKMTGKKMGLLHRLEFKLAQKKLRSSINADGTLNNKRLEKMARDVEGNQGFHAGGFFLGLLLGLIGVLIAYLINDDKHSNRVKWAWIGWGVWVVILILLIV